MSASLSILSTCLILRQGSDNWSSTGSRQSSRWDQRFLEGVVDADDDDADDDDVAAGDDDVAAGDDGDDAAGDDDGDDGDNFDLPPSTLPCCWNDADQQIEPMII